MQVLISNTTRTYKTMAAAGSAAVDVIDQLGIESTAVRWIMAVADNGRYTPVFFLMPGQMLFARLIAEHRFMVVG